MFSCHLSALALVLAISFGSQAQEQAAPATGAPAPQPAAVIAEAIPMKVSLIGRAVPSLESLPPDEYGILARYGHELSSRTFAHIGPEVKNRKMRYAGNNLACTSCHQNNATKPYAMPWVGVTATFPQYRGREDDLSTVEERVNGCMERSMNGKALPLNSREMKAFVTYIHFLSRGIPVGASIEGTATFQSKPPNRRVDLAAGEAIYQAQCTACHGANGEGRRVGVKGDAQGYRGGFLQQWRGDEPHPDGYAFYQAQHATGREPYQYRAQR